MANVIAAIKCACLRITFIVFTPGGRGIALGLINSANLSFIAQLEFIHILKFY